MVPVNLYVDRMSPVQPVRVADVYAITQDRAAEYREAAAKIGLTVTEYGEFRSELSQGAVDYVVLPRHIDAMAGVHSRNGHVYALRNVLVPSGEMGWRIALADGTTVFVPRACGNLSLNRPRPVAYKPRAVALTRRPAAVTRRKAAAAPVPVAAIEPVPVPVSFAPAPAPAPVAVAAPGSDGPSAVAVGIPSGTSAPYFAPLVPFVYGLISHNSPGTSAPVVLPCSAGSNTMGVCR